MAKLIIDDGEIDNLLWETIKADEDILGFESYLRLFSSPLHEVQACKSLDRLIHNNLHYEESLISLKILSNLEQLASQNNPKANFYLGKFLRQNDF